MNTHPEQWALGSQCCSAQGAEPRGVRCLAQGSVPHILFSCGIEGGESAGYSLSPPTIPAGPETRTCVPQVTSPTLYPLSHGYPPIWCDFKFSFVFGVLQVEIDRYIGLPIFFPIFKHFTIIGYRFCKKKNIGFDFFFFFFIYIYFLYIHNYTEYNQQWNFDLHLTHPSTHTPGAVFTQEMLQHDHRM